jgi:hypothetical protein
VTIPWKSSRRTRRLLFNPQVTSHPRILATFHSRLFRYQLSIRKWLWVWGNGWKSRPIQRTCPSWGKRVVPSFRRPLSDVHAWGERILVILVHIQDLELTMSGTVFFSIDEMPTHSACSFRVIALCVGRIIDHEVTSDYGWSGTTSAPHAFRFLQLMNLGHD